MESETPVAYEEGRNGHCGGAGPLRNGGSSIRVRRAGCWGARVIVPTGEKVTEWEGEREWKGKTLDDCDTTGSPGNLTVNRSGRAGLEGADVGVGKWTTRKTEPVTLLRQVTVFTTELPRNERGSVWRHRGLLCSNARCGSARHGVNTASPVVA
jgi:hypothetical protein